MLQALQQDYSLLYCNKAEGRGRLPWDTPNKKAKFQENLPKTLFGQRYLSSTLDEGHNFRNVGARHQAGLAILDCSEFRLVQTATPLLTSHAVC